MPGNLILGIESSCDETSAAVVRNGTEVLSNVVASQLIHSSYGGVVPELASREHLRAIVPVVREAMQHANVAYSDLAAVAVTEGPGLAGALLVGISFAKSLAFGADLPLIAVNHLEGHIHAVLMDATDTFSNADPLLALVVSGGHTHLYLATRTPEQTWHYRNVGKTLDDAAGEAYDKAAKLLGLPYPGGPWMDALAAHGTADPTLFPIAQIKHKATGNTAPKLAREASLAPDEDATRFDMSFSGIKTAVRRYVELHQMHNQILSREAALRELGLHKAKPDTANIARALPHFDAQTLNLIASFQHTVVKNLARSTFRAAEHYAAQGILVSGGVAANSHLRRIFTSSADAAKLPIAFPAIALSTDNAAMIAAAAWLKLLARDFAPDTLEPTPQLRLG
ncbi:MAG: tRNA (adenosine(37)-N6)-threonylcarbamoyltransferase complex transferase subunit TsaD [Acidobacteriaceae bacterium]